jgi:MFS transporter, MHS family, proline/betaine transporter
MNKGSPFVVSSLVLVEWFEYSIYLYLGAEIAKSLISPNFNNSLMLIYAIFSISYLSRPLGGALFGFISDKWGRKRGLLLSGYIMTLSTLCIGLIPSYKLIGLYAPLLLLAFRFTQGLAAGGEFNNSAILLMENAEKNKTMLGSWTGFASSAGMSMGALSAVIMTVYFSSMDSWRYAYYIATIISIVVLLARYKIRESYEFTHLSKGKRKINIFKELGNYKVSIFTVFISGAFLSVYIYACMVYFMDYYLTMSKIHNLNPIVIAMVAQVLVTILIPFMAIIGGLFNYLKVFQYCIIGICIAAVVLFKSALYNYSIGIIIAVVIYAISGAGISALVFRYMYNLFPTHIRCLATSFSWGMAAALFGATTPIVAHFFVGKGFVNFPWVYILVFGVIYLITINALNIKKHLIFQSP